MADAVADRAHTRTQLTLLVLSEAAARLSPRRLMRFGRPFAVPDRLLAVPRACAERACEAAARGPRAVAEVVRTEIYGAMAGLSSAKVTGTGAPQDAAS